MSVALLGACAGDQASTARASAGGNAAPAAAPAPSAGGTLAGTVREQIPVGPYVYLRLETASGELWAAVNEAPISVGQTVTVYNVMRMEQFASPTLKRTFDALYFGTLDPSLGSAPVAPGAAGAMTDASPGTPDAIDAGVGPVARASGPDARTIGEVWAQKAQLAGRTVSVRGVVVKYNPEVMGKNWIHLQDGSGHSAAGTHDLAVTSEQPAAVGDTVTITGIVRTNRDLGAGYVYALLVEDAKVTRR